MKLYIASLYFLCVSLSLGLLSACQVSEFSADDSQDGQQSRYDGDSKPQTLENKVFSARTGEGGGIIGTGPDVQGGGANSAYPVVPDANGKVEFDDGVIHHIKGDLSQFSAHTRCTNDTPAPSNLKNAVTGVVVSLHSAEQVPAFEWYLFSAESLGKQIRADIINTRSFKLPLKDVKDGKYIIQMCSKDYAAQCHTRWDPQPIGTVADHTGKLALQKIDVANGRRAGDTTLDLSVLYDGPNAAPIGSIDAGGGPAIDANGARCDKYLSPLMVDIGNTGFSLSAPLDGVTFDIDADGTPNSISWPLESSNMFLVLDVNGNGQIDDGSELFGNKSFSVRGESFANGFEALAQYDDNKDKIIDHNDVIFSDLRLWSDVNRDGISAPSELFSLSAKKLASIDLQYIEVDERDQWHNATKQRSTATVDGRMRMIVDIWFRLID